MIRVHVLPVDPRLQPATQPFQYPAHNDDYGVEQDMLRWLEETPGVRAADAGSADWHYLPVFWTRWHLHHDYGNHGREELAALAGAAVLDDARTFTVCQNDDGPLIDLGRATLMLASRKGTEGIDVPLLSSAHRARPEFLVRRRWLASFVGRLATHPVRRELADALEGRRDVRILDGDHGTRRFVNTTLASHVALSPRGYGGSSFRFFEAAQLGRVPMLVGDLDTRPFPRSIDWSAASFYAADGHAAAAVLDGLEPERLGAMGATARRVWSEDLTWGRWCRHALAELTAAER
ncbi:MAG: exostosin family protein [Solirubrobacteraceae bacterium]